ncbi:hypothetical protein [Nocardia sp. CA-119907]
MADLFLGVGRHGMVDGQGDMIVDIALDIVARREAVV